MVIPPRAGGASEKEKEQRGGALGDAAAKGESGEFKFVMLFDERGRLALHQPRSGFNPLVVR